MVYRIALTRAGTVENAEDIFQEVFLKYSEKEPKFQSEEHEKAWLIRITINKSKDLLKSGWFSKRADETEIPQDFSLEQEQSDMLEKVLNLPEKYRAVIHLYYYEDYSVNEISQITGIKPSTVQTRLQRGRKLLEKKLKEEWCYEKRNILPGNGQY